MSFPVPFLFSMIPSGNNAGRAEYFCVFIIIHPSNSAISRNSGAVGFFAILKTVGTIRI
jgi:hypothetical protein